MNATSNFSLKLLCVMAVFCYHTTSCLAEDTTVSVDTADPSLCSTSDTGDPSLSGTFQTQTICPAGQYLSACGNYTIGTNWLKGMRLVTSTQINGGGSIGNNMTQISTTTSVTQDYFSYDNDDLTNMKNLSNLFRGNAISYKATANATNYTTATSEQVLKSRNHILVNFCSPFEDVTFTCLPCPGNGTVEASTVEASTNRINCGKWKWNIQTIADCHVREFVDSTGTYVLNPAGSPTGDGEDCNYSKAVTGRELNKGMGSQSPTEMQQAQPIGGL